MTPTPAALKAPRYWPQWAAISTLRLLAMAPLPVLWGVAWVMGSLAFVLHAPRRRVVQANLRACFPDHTPAARRRLARRHFHAFFYGALTAPIAWWTGGARLERLVRAQGMEHLNTAIAAGTPVILLAPHFIGIEMGAMYLASRPNVPLTSMYKAPKNTLLDFLMRRQRLRFGGLLVERAEGLKAIVRALRKGAAFYYLPDQDPGRVGTVFVPFFGVPTATLTALSRLAALTRAAVIPCHTRALPRGRGFALTLDAPLENFPSGDDLADAARMNREIERIVLQMPEQYFWVHKRFKTRPEGEASIYKKK